MSRVLITGIDGFTGRHLAVRLAADGHEVHGMAQQPQREPIAGVARIHVSDLTDLQSLTEAIHDAAPERIVHLAAIAHVAASDVELMYRVNLVGSRHLLEALASLPVRPQAVLLASSANVYGNSRAGALDESTSPDPVNDYAVSKLAMEFVARQYASRLPLVVCRPFNYTGVGQALSFLLPKIVDHARRRAAAIELGNIEVARDFSDVRDVVSAYARLLVAPDAPSRTINICSGRAVSLRGVLALVESISGHRLPVEINPALVRRNEVLTLRGDRTLLDRLLPDLPPPIPLEDTLRWMLNVPFH